MPSHTDTGNCFDIAYSCAICGVGIFCDVCHEHDELRGDCEQCMPCIACEERDPSV